MAVVMFYGGMIWYVFPDIDKTISWEGHLAGLITGFVFAIRFKTPDYVKDIQYNWEKPDFNPDEDMFMKHFDENGNFVNTPEPEEDTSYSEPAEQIQVDNLSPIITYTYVLKEASEDNKQTE